MSKTPVSGILHAFAESLETGLRGYEKITFDPRFTGSYVNWDVDYIGFRPVHCLADSLFRRFRHREVIKNYRRIMIFPEKDHLYLHVRHVWRCTKSFEELVFLIYGDFGEWNRLSGNITLAPMTNPMPHEQSKMETCMTIYRLVSLQWHIPGFEKLGAMRFVREPDRHLSLPEDAGRGDSDPDEELLLSKPEIPKRINFKFYRLPISISPDVHFHRPPVPLSSCGPTTKTTLRKYSKTVLVHGNRRGREKWD